jgi:hypothetical protein
MARINVITNLNSAIGLKRDYDLLHGILSAAGHQVNPVQFNAPGDVPPVDLNIFIETVVPNIFQYGKKNWLIPNPEWYQPQFNSHIRSFDKILCKTQDALNIFRVLSRAHQATMPIEFIGWESKDFYNPGIPRERRFLHVAGNSSMKNTQAIMWAWATGKIKSPLTIISMVYSSGAGIPNVRFYPTVREDEMGHFLNSHLFNLCTSHYEGFGHALHEAMSVGAVILSTDRAPMNEFHAAVRVGTESPRPQCLAQTWSVTGHELLKGAILLEEMSESLIQSASEYARSSFMTSNIQFRNKIKEIIGELPA